MRRARLRHRHAGARRALRFTPGRRRHARAAAALDRVEAELRESESRFRLLAENATEVISRHRADGSYVYVSPACRSVLGYEAEELIGANPYDFIHPDDAADVAASHNLVLTTDLVSNVTYRFRHRDGHDIWLDSISRMLRDPAGRLLEIHVSSRDVTERRRAEEEARRREAELAHASRLSMLGELAASLAHELNQPLTAIAATLGGLERRLADGAGLQSAVLRDDLAFAGAQAERAGAIIRHMRGLVSPQPPRPTTCDLPRLIQDALELARPVMRQAGVKVDVDCPPDLPRVLVDPIQIQQVVMNLLTNAINAMADTSADRRHVGITIRHERPWLRTRIADQGHGVKLEDCERIFDPFYSTRGDGMGIGLRISRSIIQAHGGQLTARPGEAGGAVLTFDLPVDKDRLVSAEG